MSVFFLPPSMAINRRRRSMAIRVLALSLSLSRLLLYSCKSHSLLTLNIALKSTAPRRVRPEPREGPGVSATTMMLSASETKKPNEEKNGFSFLTSFHVAREKKTPSRSLFSLSLLSLVHSNCDLNQSLKFLILSTKSRRPRRPRRSRTSPPLPPPSKSLHLHLRPRRSRTAPCRASRPCPPR